MFIETAYAARYVPFSLPGLSTLLWLGFVIIAIRLLSILEEKTGILGWLALVITILFFISMIILIFIKSWILGLIIIAILYYNL